jgi:hypothetical protein
LKYNSRKLLEHVRKLLEHVGDVESIGGDCERICGSMYKATAEARVVFKPLVKGEELYWGAKAAVEATVEPEVRSSRG